MTTIEIIKELCKENQIKVYALELEMGFSNTSLSKPKNISFERIIALADRFNKPLDFFRSDTTASYAEHILRFSNNRSNAAPTENAPHAQTADETRLLREFRAINADAQNVVFATLDALYSQTEESRREKKDAHAQVA